MELGVGADQNNNTHHTADVSIQSTTTSSDEIDHQAININTEISIDIPNTSGEKLHHNQPSIIEIELADGVRRITDAVVNVFLEMSNFIRTVTASFNALTGVNTVNIQPAQIDETGRPAIKTNGGQIDYFVGLYLLWLVTGSWNIFIRVIRNTSYYFYRNFPFGRNN